MTKYKLSDINYMRNPEDITNKALAMLKGVRLVEFDNENDFTSLKQFAVPGQDLEKSIPSAVYRDGVGMVYVDHMVLIPVLIGAINSLVASGASANAKIIELEERITALEPAAAEASTETTITTSTKKTTGK